MTLRENYEELFKEVNDCNCTDIDFKTISDTTVQLTKNIILEMEKFVSKYITLGLQIPEDILDYFKSICLYYAIPDNANNILDNTNDMFSNKKKIGSIDISAPKSSEVKYNGEEASGQYIAKCFADEFRDFIISKVGIKLPEQIKIKYKIDDRHFSMEEHAYMTYLITGYNYYSALYHNIDYEYINNSNSSFVNMIELILKDVADNLSYEDKIKEYYKCKNTKTDDDYMLNIIKNQLFKKGLEIASIINN